MKHCACCIHRDSAPDGPNCSYEVDGYDFHKEQRPCRELNGYGATYHCFKSNGDVEAWGALDWLLEAFDKLEARVERIEEGLRAASRR